MTTPQTAAIVVAAGRSSRMGRPKALVELRGRTVASWLASSFASCDLRLLVVRAGAEWPTPELRRDWTIVTNPNAEQGMLSSIQAGISAAQHAPLVLVTPVDCPCVAPATIRKLIEAARTASGRSAVPRFAGRPGHPVLLAAALQAEVLAADPRATSLQDLLQQADPRPLQVEVDDEAILLNVNSPRELERLERQGARR